MKSTEHRILGWRLTAIAIVGVLHSLAGPISRGSGEERPEPMNFTDTMPEIVEAIDAGLAEWMSRVTFRGHYRHRIGAAFTVEDALAGRFVDPETGNRLLKPHPKDPESADGFVAKTEEAFRWEYRRITAIHRNGNSVTNPSFDIAVANGVIVEHRPAYKLGVGQTGAGLVSVYLVTKKGLEGRFPCKGPPTMPLFAVAGSTGRPFSPREGYNERTRWAIRQIDPTRLVVAVERVTNAPKGTQAQSVGLRDYYWIKMGRRYPVVERIDSYEMRYGQVGDLGSRTVFSDLCVVGNGCVIPRHVSSVLRLDTRARNGKRLWLGRSWHSDDLGRKKPTRADFVISVPKGTIIEGLPGKRDSVFDVMSIDPKSVVAPTSGPAQSATVTSGSTVTSGPSVPPEWNPTNLVRLGGIGLILLGVACLAVLMRRPRRAMLE